MQYQRILFSIFKEEDFARLKLSLTIISIIMCMVPQFDKTLLHIPEGYLCAISKNSVC